jgi:IS30 family transposase
MKYRKRIYYTEEQKSLTWDRWQAGDSTYEIAKLFDKGHASIQGVLAETGGVRSTICCVRRLNSQTNSCPPGKLP